MSGLLASDLDAVAARDAIIARWMTAAGLAIVSYDHCKFSLYSILAINLYVRTVKFSLYLKRLS